MAQRIVYGNVNADGTVFSEGSGDWVLTHDDTGEYTIVFTEAFNSMPTVVTLQNYPGWSDFNSNGGNATDNTVLIAVSEQKCKVLTGTEKNPPGASHVDRNFSFIAIGT